MNILVLHGPNLRTLGKREPEIYGSNTLVEINEEIYKIALALNIVVKIFQSNHEGELIDMIEENSGVCDAIIINGGGLTHTSISLMDALKATGIRIIEVHLSDPSKREEFRHTSYIGMVAEESFVGMGVNSYIEAIKYVNNRTVPKIQKKFQ